MNIETKTPFATQPFYKMKDVSETAVQMYNNEVFHILMLEQDKKAIQVKYGVKSIKHAFHKLLAERYHTTDLNKITRLANIEREWSLCSSIMQLMSNIVFDEFNAEKNTQYTYGNYAIPRTCDLDPIITTIATPKEKVVINSKNHTESVKVNSNTITTPMFDFMTNTPAVVEKQKVEVKYVVDYKDKYEQLKKDYDKLVEELDMLKFALQLAKESRNK